MTHFNALWVTETPEKTYKHSIIQRSINDLPPGEVLIEVHYSSLNYKDALSASGNKGVTRSYPHTPGIDAAGVVAHSHNPAFALGDEVVVTGFDLGMNTAGGFAGYIRVPASWVVKLPAGMSLRDSMIYGTAGFTAALSIYKLEHAGLRPEQGDVLVTGATGGVGSVAVALLAKLGYRVVASSGKHSVYTFLRELGAAETVSREELLQDSSDKPMLKGRWAGVLDTVGGAILANALKALKYAGKASCCGLVASPQLHTTVFPFILRGIDLLGVDSVDCPMEVRLKLWHKMANEWRLDNLETLMTQVSLAELKEVYLHKILQGQVQGRVVVKCA